MLILRTPYLHYYRSQCPSPWINKYRMYYSMSELIYEFFTLASLYLPLLSWPTTSRELLLQFSTCSGWRWLEGGGNWKCILLLLQPFHEDVLSKTPGCRKLSQRKLCQRKLCKTKPFFLLTGHALTLYCCQYVLSIYSWNFANVKKMFFFWISWPSITHCLSFSVNSIWLKTGFKSDVEAYGPSSAAQPSKQEIVRIVNVWYQIK